MRRRWTQVAGIVALVAMTGAGAAAFQIAPDVVTEVTTRATGLWVPTPLTGEIVHVDALSGLVTARVDVAEPGALLEVEERDGAVIVLDRSAGRVSLVDPALHTVVREVGGLPVDGSRFDIGPEAIVTGDSGSVAVVDPEVTGAQIVPIDESVRSVAAAGSGAEVDNGLRRYVVSADGAVDGSSASVGHLVRVIDRVVAVTGDEVRDLDGDRVGCFESDITRPDAVIGTDDEWVVAIDGSMIHVADLVGGACVAVDLGDDIGRLGRPVVAARRVFVPETDTGMVHVIDPARRATERHGVLAPGVLRLRARDHMVVAYDDMSQLAALIDEDGLVRLIDTTGEEGGIVITDGGVNAVVGNNAGAPAVAVDGADGKIVSAGAPIVDANVLATSVRDQPDDVPAPLPDDELVANFSFSATTVVVDELVRFVDSSTGNPESWRWDFGDGTGDEGPSVEKAWSEPGTYPVTLTVQRGTDEDLISLGITVVPDESALPPAADFVYSATVVQVGDPLHFEDRSDGDIDQWRWDFGDGTTAFTPDASHAWSAPGRYRVELTVANEQGSSDRSFIDIEVLAALEAPEAVLVATSTDVDLGEPVTFRGSSATDPATFSWDFGDGRTASGAEVVHVFLDTGTYTVTLTARNDAGTSTAEVEVVVSPPTVAPVAVIGTLPEVIEVGDVVTISSLSTNGPDVEEWTFGDGGTATGSTVTHAWTDEGTYLLTLTATNSAGSHRETTTVEVVSELPTPVALIGDHDQTPWVNETTVFIDGGSLHATSWLWDFGDGSTSTSINPLHTFTTPGQKVVTLTVSNRNGSHSTSVVVEPRPEPIARFAVSSDAVRTGELVEFSDRSDNAASWSWAFGDGATSTAQNPTHTYTETGEWTVTLTIENGLGDSSVSSDTIFVDPARPLLEAVSVDAGPDGEITTLETVRFTAVADPESGPIDAYEIDFGDGSGIFGSSSASFAHAYDAAGPYTVQMRAHGGLDEWSAWVPLATTVVDPSPPSVAIADFASPQQVGFIAFSGVDLGGGPIATWRWQIARRGTVEAEYTGQNPPAHFFGEEGNYIIRLTATSPVPSVPDHVVSKPLHIDPPPPPSIDELSASPSPATTGVLVQFPTEVTGSVTTWEWNYEGSWESGGETGQHIFNTPGAKTVRLRITDAFSQSVVDTVDLFVNPRPDIDPIAVNPPSPVPTGTIVSLSSNDPAGLPNLTWDWRVYRTGTSPPAAPSQADAGESVTHSFTEAGDWTVSVTATDQNGVSDTEFAFVIVQDPLEAAIGYVPSGSLEISFSDVSTGPPVDTWLWDFGSAGAVGDPSAPDPVVTYPGPGTYTVTLTVWSGAQFDSTNVLVNVT